MHYQGGKSRVPKDMAESFKAKCSEKGVAQAQVIKQAIEFFLREV